MAHHPGRSKVGKGTENKGRYKNPNVNVSDRLVTSGI
jgi:hypothetical protein